MKSFGQWFGDQGRGAEPKVIKQADDDLPDGLHIYNGYVHATCRVCDGRYVWPACVTDFDPDMSYCGRSPSCCP